MTLKEQILLKAGEEIPKPVKKPKPKKKKNKPKIKLSSLLEELLLEAVDVSSGEKIIKALERGQIPGVKKKVFLNTQKVIGQVTSILDEVIETLSARVNTNQFNAYIFLTLKKFGNIDTLANSKSVFNEFIDTMQTYFGNINKQEAIQDPEVKKRFEEYFNSPFDFQKDKKFERWANEKFAQKAKAKDKDIIEVYSDNQGWTVSIPKTFGAASKLACMGDRKTKWCTAASVRMFNDYSDKGKNPLYIIRNEKKNFLLQMDWGEKPGGAVSFKDEKDASMLIKDVMNLNIPDNIWKTIKNKAGKSIYNYFQEFLKIKEEEEEEKRIANDKNKAEELEKKIKWEVKEINAEEAAKKIRDIDRGVKIYTDSYDFDDIDNLSVERALNDNLRANRKRLRQLRGGARVFKFVSDKGRELYGVIGNIERTIRKNKGSNHNIFIYNNAFLEIKGNDIKVIDKSDIISGLETGIPNELKKEFFKGTDFEKIEKAEIKEVEGVFELEDLDLLAKKRDLFDDPVSFKRFQEELKNSHYEDGNNIFIKKEKNGNVSAVWYYGNAIHIVKYTKDKNTINYSNKLGADKVKNFPDEMKDKILDSIEDEDIRNIFINTIKNNEFVHSLLGGKYYYDMVNNKLLDKDKNELASISESNVIIKRIKKELSEDEYRKFLQQKSIITEFKYGLKNTLEKERYGFSGEVTLAKIRKNRELFRGRMEKALNKPSILDIVEVDDNEKRRIANEIINGNKEKIKLAETTMDFYKRSLANGKSKEIRKGLPVELYFDANKERTQSEFYYVGKEEPYFAIGFTKEAGYSFGYLKSQTTYLENGKEKSYGYVNVRTSGLTELYVKFIRVFFAELKTK